MYSVLIEVKEHKLELVMKYLKELKDDAIVKYEIIKDSTDRVDENEEKSLMALSDKVFEKVWDNEEDRVYDKFLEV